MIASQIPSQQDPRSSSRFFTVYFKRKALFSTEQLNPRCCEDRGFFSFIDFGKEIHFFLCLFFEKLQKFESIKKFGFRNLWGEEDPDEGQCLLLE